MTAKVNKGGVRPVGSESKAYQNRLREFNARMATSGYSKGYFSVSGGGFYVVTRSKYPHKKEELEAAHILADHGYKVYLQDEVGSVSKGDGVIFTFSYEQITPDKASGAHGFKKCLEHAKLKRVQISLVFDKNRRFVPADIYGGVALFEKHFTYRFSKMIVIDNSGKIHTYKHDT